MTMALYEKSQFTTNAVDGQPLAHDVYTKGSGPVIVIIQELPGIGPQTLRLADDLVTAGFRVVVPHLFGPIGSLSLVGNLARVFCMRREFALFSANKSSPIVNWLAALCQGLKQQYQVAGVGVIGMCLTGNFAMSLMANDAVLAAVSSQPSLPLFKQSALHMSDQEIKDIRRGIDEKGAMLAYRFAGDKICASAKFDAIDRAFNQDKMRVKMDHVEGRKHSVLTEDFIDGSGSPTDKALQEILSYFTEKL